MPDNLLGWSTQEILSAAENLGADMSDRVVGVFVQGGLSGGALLQAGGEGIYFLGVDTTNMQQVEAHYAGVTVSGGVPIPWFNFGPGAASGGVFNYSGDPASLSGWSLAGQLSIGFTDRAVWVGDGGGNAELELHGSPTSVGVSASLGYTYRVNVDGRAIFNFGDITYRGTGEFSGEGYGQALEYVENNHGNARITFSFIYNGETYTVTQTVQKIRERREDDASIVNIRTEIVDDQGNRMSAEFLEDFGFSHRTDVRAIRDGGFRSFERCFLPGTPIFLPDGMASTIESLRPGDWVQSYDASGTLVPGRVARVIRNRVRHIIDVFDLMVTPGHVTLCGDGPFAGRHVPILDILRSDGALVRADGSLVRAATGAEVGSEADRLVWAVAGCATAQGFEVAEARELRLGARVLTEAGADFSLGELIAANGGRVTADGLVAQADGPDGTPGQPAPFAWPFGPRLPAPEDYVLARSGVSLGDIYRAAEWEDVRPRLPAPPRAGMGGGDRVLHDASDAGDAPRPNLPLALREERETGVQGPRAFSAPASKPARRVQ